MSTVPDAIRLKRPSAAGSAGPAPLAANAADEVPVQPVAWQRELAAAVRDVAELRRRLQLPPEPAAAAPAAATAVQRFPVLVTDSFLRRMVPGDPQDPLLRQVLPDPREDLPATGFLADPVGDLPARRAPGLLQKYEGRALLIAGGACAIHCRYCFRREYPYHADPRALADWEPALEQLAADHSLTEVIFSGGDPLLLTDLRLQQLLDRMDQLPHIQRIRLHTRLPIVLPSRITPELLRLLSTLRAQPLCVVHANHPQEIAGDCAQALKTLVRSGIPVLNQTVLLRTINDRADVLCELSRRLINLGVMPYYLHQLDRVSGTAHFEVPPDVGRQLVAELARQLPGYAVPKYVQEIAGAAHKTPV